MSATESPHRGMRRRDFLERTGVVAAAGPVALRPAEAAAQGQAPEAVKRAQAREIYAALLESLSDGEVSRVEAEAKATVYFAELEKTPEQHQEYVTDALVAIEETSPPGSFGAMSANARLGFVRRRYEDDAVEEATVDRAGRIITAVRIVLQAILPPELRFDDPLAILYRPRH